MRKRIATAPVHEGVLCEGFRYIPINAAVDALPAMSDAEQRQCRTVCRKL